MTEHTTIDAETGEEITTAIATRADTSIASPMDMADMSLLPVEQQTEVLAEFDARRQCFLQWLLSKFDKGVHYGNPPGCEIKVDAQGRILQWNKRQNKSNVIEKDSWRAKPSLYKAGALLLIDLLKLRTVFTPDEIGWEQFGSPNGTLVYKCELYAQSGVLLGEGRGVFKVGEKGMNENAALKMCEKRATVDAVLNAIPVVGELFTQDQKEVNPPITNKATAGVDPYQSKHQPKEDDSPAKSTRAKAVYLAHKKLRPSENFHEWAMKVTGGKHDLTKQNEWTWDDVETIEGAIEIMEGGE